MTEVASWIAIVDDEPSVLKGLARLLHARAFEVKTYTSARDFIDALSDGLPEILILDLQMPGMTGLDVQRHLTGRGIQIPTIIITAQPEGVVRASCERAGAIAFLTKPLQETFLLAAIENARASTKS
jgi:FixJ family two-component response regulator